MIACGDDLKQELLNIAADLRFSLERQTYLFASCENGVCSVTEAGEVGTKITLKFTKGPNGRPVLSEIVKISGFGGVGISYVEQARSTLGERKCSDDE